MGWLYMQSIGSFTSPKTYLDAQFTWNREDISIKVLRSTVVGKSVYYAAIEHIRLPDAERIVFAAVCLIRYRPRARDGYVFGYKDMDETVGPYQKSCPAAILDLLTPTESAYAVEWRAACRANLERTRKQAARPTPRPGQVITFNEPIACRDGRLLTRFHVIQHPSKPHAVLYHAVDGGGVYRILTVKRRAYSLTVP